MILVDPLAHPVIAHRGASGQSPENTLLAFRKALEQRADALELDVRLTKDGIPVVIHDPTVERTTDGTGMVGDMTLAAISELNAGCGESIPTLAEVLEEIQGTPIMVEIKETWAGQAVVAAIRAAGAGDRVLVGSFESAPLRAVRAAGLRTMASRPETGRFWLATRLGWAPPGDRYQAFSLPEYRGRIRVVDSRFVRLARQKGRPVHVWTVDDVETARRLRSLGVAGILTNYPDRMGALGSEEWGVGSGKWEVGSGK